MVKRLRISFQGEPTVSADGLDLVCEREESKNFLISLYDEAQTLRTPSMYYSTRIPRIGYLE